MAGLVLRDVRTGKSIANFVLGGYICTAKPLVEETKALWSPSSRWLAIRYRETKTSRRIALYCLKHGRCERVYPPSYVQNVFGREDLVKRGRYLFEDPMAWSTTEMTENWAIEVLSLEVNGTSSDDAMMGPEAGEFRYRVEAEFVTGKNRAPTIELTAVKKVEDEDAPDNMDSDTAPKEEQTTR